MFFFDNLFFIGFLSKVEGDISPAQKSTFYTIARAFYARALEYAINLQLKDDLLQNAKFLNFHRRESANISEVDTL